MAEQKRSHSVLLLSAGAIAAAAGLPLAFGAFGSTSTSTQACYPSYVYPGYVNCQTANRISAQVCVDTYREAEATARRLPGFATKDLCSAQFLAGDCAMIDGQWRPRQAAYRIFDRKGQTPAYIGEPLFFGPENKWRTADGQTVDGDATCRGTRRTSHYYSSPRYFGAPAPTATPSGGPGIVRRVFGGTPLGFGPRVAS